MRLFLNLAFIVDIILVFIFIVSPSWELLIAKSVTDPEEMAIMSIIIIVSLIVLSPITYALNIARKFFNGRK